jgi:CubicO group peptidase (beta-lactamase class C family)
MLRTGILRQIVWVALSLAPFTQAQVSEKQAEVDHIFSSFNTHTPGCAVGVAQGGKVVLRAGYGMADLERNVPITPDTIFESGSVAKQFTAATVMLLAKQGKISLDDPMRKYLPELADYGAPLTIRHVLSHISGLREWRPIATFGGRPEDSYVYTNQDILQMASRQRALNFDPGTTYTYSNTGFNLFPILIERVLGNGNTFEAFTAEMIFSPLDMEHTRWRNDFRAIIPNRALAYGHPEGGSGWTQETPIENLIGAGGLLTTVGDLLLWNENFTHARVGGPEFVKAQQTPAILSNGRSIPYAAGLMIGTVNGLREVSHSGATGGYRTWLGRYPDQSVSVAVMCNSAAANPSKLGRETASLWTGASTKKAPITAYKADPAKLAALAGMYRKLHDNTVMRIKWHDGKLSAEPGNVELTPAAADRFIAGSTTAELQFADGPPIHLKMITPMDEISYERVEAVEPTPRDLAALIGEYESRETGTTLKLAPGNKPGEMTYRIGTNAPVVLRPTFRDAFETPSGSSIYFIRDSSGRVVALSAGEDRVWDLRFKRIY